MTPTSREFSKIESCHRFIPKSSHSQCIHAEKVSEIDKLDKLLQLLVMCVWRLRYSYMSYLPRATHLRTSLLMQLTKISHGRGFVICFPPRFHSSGCLSRKFTLSVRWYDTNFSLSRHSYQLTQY